MSARAPIPGTMIGRYRVLAPVGPGETARFLAYDPELDRRIELRVIDISSRDDAEIELVLERLRARASWKNPHLSAIHDMWREQTRLLIAAEHVDDPSLRRWLSGGRIDDVRVELVAMELADVLAWLHAHEIAHGGIDLDSVHLSERGLVTVEALPRDPMAVLAGPRELSARPAGPEFVRDVRSWGRVIDALLAAPKVRRAAWLARVSSRCDGDDEVVPGSMDRVHEALLASPVRRRGRILTGLSIAAVVGIVVAGFAGVRRGTASACRDGQARIEAVWSAERRAKIEDTFEATGVDFARTARDRVLVGLDAWADEWIGAWTETCTQEKIEGTLAEHEAAARRTCLENALYGLGATADVLGGADIEVVARAGRTVAELEPPSACIASGRGTSRDEKTERELAMIAALRSVGRYDEGRTRAHALVEQARAAEDRALEAEVLEAEGFFAGKAGSTEEGADLLRQAIVAAWDSERDEVAARAWMELVYALGEQLGAPASAEEAARHAWGAIERAGGNPEQRASLRAYEVVVAIGRGDYPLAIERARAHVELLERSYGPHDARIGSALNNLANAYLGLDRHDEALAVYERALEIWTTSLGPAHPDLASLHNNRGAVFVRRNDLVAAERELVRAYEIRREALGPTHPLVGASVDNLGVVADAKGDTATALRHHREALDIKRAAHGERHPALADTLLNIGNALQTLGDVEEALLNYRLASGIYRDSLGTEHPHRSLAVHNEGRALFELGRTEEALARHEEALAIRLASLGPSHQSTLTSLARVGECLSKLGRDDELAERLEAHLAMAPPHHERDDARAEVELLLARALAERPRERDRALALAQLALARVPKDTELHERIAEFLER